MKEFVVKQKESQVSLLRDVHCRSWIRRRRNALPRAERVTKWIWSVCIRNHRDGAISRSKI